MSLNVYVWSVFIACDSSKENNCKNENESFILPFHKKQLQCYCGTNIQNDGYLGMQGNTMKEAEGSVATLLAAPC